MKRLAIDPGDIHVGYTSDASGEVVTGEWSPTQCCWEVIHMMTHRQVDELILEEYVLYADKSEDQHWSPMRTCQLIGALKLIAAMFRIPVIEQGAYVKIPTRNQLRGRKIKQVGKNIHELDSELHYYYRRLREGKK